MLCAVVHTFAVKSEHYNLHAQLKSDIPTAWFFEDECRDSIVAKLRESRGVMLENFISHPIFRQVFVDGASPLQSSRVTGETCSMVSSCLLCCSDVAALRFIKQLLITVPFRFKLLASARSSGAKTGRAVHRAGGRFACVHRRDAGCRRICRVSAAAARRWRQGVLRLWEHTLQLANQMSRCQRQAAYDPLLLA